MSTDNRLGILILSQLDSISPDLLCLLRLIVWSSRNLLTKLWSAWSWRLNERRLLCYYLLLVLGFLDDEYMERFADGSIESESWIFVFKRKGSLRHYDGVIWCPLFSHEGIRRRYTCNTYYPKLIKTVWNLLVNRYLYSNLTAAAWASRRPLGTYWLENGIGVGPSSLFRLYLVASFK